MQTQLKTCLASNGALFCSYFSFDKGGPIFHVEPSTMRMTDPVKPGLIDCGGHPLAENSIASQSKLEAALNEMDWRGQGE
jgi:hypothetical protein